MSDEIEKKIRFCLNITGSNREVLGMLEAVDEKFYQQWLDSRMVEDDDDPDSECSGQVEVETLGDLWRLLCAFYESDSNTAAAKLHLDVLLELWGTYRDGDVVTQVALTANRIENKIIGARSLETEDSVWGAAIEARDVLVRALSKKPEGKR